MATNVNGASPNLILQLQPGHNAQSYQSESVWTMGKTETCGSRSFGEHGLALQGGHEVGSLLWRGCGDIVAEHPYPRLLDFKTQERYYTKIVERYMTFCSDAGERDELLRRFASLDLEENAAITPPSPLPPSTIIPPSDTKALSDVMMALRKLREAIVASARVDDFAVQAYLFCIRLAILVQHPESYHPAILHMLRRMNPPQNLTSIELQEVLGYLVLDTACRRSQLAEAYALRHKYKLRDAKVDAALDALAHDNYVAFRRVKRSVDGHKARLMEFAEGDMRVHTLKCFGRTYLSVELEFLERSAGAKWEDLVRRDGVGWQLEGMKVIIRKVKAK